MDAQQAYGRADELRREFEDRLGDPIDCASVTLLRVRGVPFAGKALVSLEFLTYRAVSSLRVWVRPRFPTSPSLQESPSRARLSNRTGNENGGGPHGTRTHGLRVANAALSQLS
ncbi:uncharacterized protein METZ01_LOCUS101469 [marine metagenome]|uniref:Uncharacterized protein n=1 Tax=marine metagenome TaxID=408172 RepID=A0A381W807_9ZZZZ